MEENRFRQARRMAGNNSLEYVADKAKVSKNTIWKLEHGKVDAGYEVVTKLANYYGVNVAWLAGQPDTSPSLDKDSQMVTRVTGLSAEAVEKLCELNAEQIDCLNALITSYDFQKALFELSYAKKVSEWDNEFIIEKPDDELIERAHYFEIDHHGEKMTIGNRTYEFGKQIIVTNEQVIKLHRSEALQDMGNAFRAIAPADNDERKVK